jgi:hypothetical protein
MIVREEIVNVDDSARRVVWAIVGGKFLHYNGTAQVFPDGAGLSRFVWTADLLPNELAGGVAGMIEQGIAVKKKTMEARA